MFWTTFKRIVRSGFIQFWRSSFVSLSSILVMVITLLIISALIFSSVILNAALQEIKNKVDINVYFVADASEQNVLAVKADIDALPEVASTTYMSQDEVLTDFKTRHQDDSTILQSLDEIGTNPLGAVITIQAKDPSQYESIYNYLQGQSFLSSDGLSIIDKINYVDTKTAIDKLSSIISSGEELGIIITCIMIALSVIVTFNTIRLAIYVSRDEISVMKLVGASNKYIRGPFVVIGVIYGLFSALVTLIILYPVTYWLGRITVDFFAGVNVYGYYISNFAEIFLILMGSGIVIGALSSYLAVRKYLTKIY